MADPRLDVTQLVYEHHAAVYRYAFRLAGKEADAEDLTQQVFLVAVEKIDQIREPERARGWLYTVLRRIFLRSRRQRAAAEEINVDLDLDCFPEETADEEIDRERLQMAIDELPDEFRVVVLMFYFEQMSYREIAEGLDLPVGTVMSRLSRAKSHLRRKLLRHQPAAASSQEGSSR